MSNFATAEKEKLIAILNAYYVEQLQAEESNKFTDEKLLEKILELILSEKDISKKLQQSHHEYVEDSNIYLFTAILAQLNVEECTELFNKTFLKLLDNKKFIEFANTNIKVFLDELNYYKDNKTINSNQHHEISNIALKKLALLKNPSTEINPLFLKYLSNNNRCEDAMFLLYYYCNSSPEKIWNQIFESDLDNVLGYILQNKAWFPKLIEDFQNNLKNSGINNNSVSSDNHIGKNYLSKIIEKSAVKCFEKLKKFNKAIDNFSVNLSNILKKHFTNLNLRFAPNKNYQYPYQEKVVHGYFEYDDSLKNPSEIQINLKRIRQKNYNDLSSEKLQKCFNLALSIKNYQAAYDILEFFTQNYPKESLKDLKNEFSPSEYPNIKPTSAGALKLFRLLLNEFNLDLANIFLAKYPRILRRAFLNMNEDEKKLFKETVGNVLEIIDPYKTDDSNLINNLSKNINQVFSAELEVVWLARYAFYQFQKSSSGIESIAKYALENNCISKNILEKLEGNNDQEKLNTLVNGLTKKYEILLNNKISINEDLANEYNKLRNGCIAIGVIGALLTVACLAPPILTSAFIMASTTHLATITGLASTQIVPLSLAIFSCVTAASSIYAVKFHRRHKFALKEVVNIKSGFDKNLLNDYLKDFSSYDKSFEDNMNKFINETNKLSHTK